MCQDIYFTFKGIESLKLLLCLHCLTRTVHKITSCAVFESRHKDGFIGTLTRRDVTDVIVVQCIDIAAVYRGFSCHCFGGGLGENMQVGGHSEHVTGPVDAIDFH